MATESTEEHGKINTFYSNLFVFFRGFRGYLNKKYRHMAWLCIRWLCLCHVAPGFQPAATVRGALARQQHIHHLVGVVT